MVSSKISAQRASKPLALSPTAHRPEVLAKSRSNQPGDMWKLDLIPVPRDQEAGGQSSCRNRGSGDPRKGSNSGVCSQNFTKLQLAAHCLTTMLRRARARGKKDTTRQFTQVRATLRCKTLLLLCVDCLQGRMSMRVQGRRTASGGLRI
jgi:hypothetical protein